MAGGRAGCGVMVARARRRRLAASSDGIVREETELREWREGVFSLIGNVAASGGETGMKPVSLEICDDANGDEIVPGSCNCGLMGRGKDRFLLTGRLNDCSFTVIGSRSISSASLSVSFSAILELRNTPTVAKDKWVASSLNLFSVATRTRPGNAVGKGLTQDLMRLS